jgi:hypothetical protein
MKTFSKKPAALTAAVLAALIVMELAPQAGAAVGMDVEDWYFQGRAAGGCGFTRRAGSSTPCRRITTSKSIGGLRSSSPAVADPGGPPLLRHLLPRRQLDSGGPDPRSWPHGSHPDSFRRHVKENFGFFRFPEGVPLLVVHDDAQRLAIWWPTAVGQQKTGRKE